MRELIVRMEDSGQLTPIVELVRCKDCRFNNNPEERASETYWMPCEEFVTDGNWFCGWGKPKEGEQE